MPVYTTCCWVNDFAGLESLFKAFFASIPYQWHTNNEIANYEGYYASVFYSYFASVGFDIVVEDSSSQGRLDMAVRFNGQCVSVRVQSGGIGTRGDCDGAIAGKRDMRTNTATYASRFI